MGAKRDEQSPASSTGSRLRRDLGTVESYAALMGMLVGAGIFRVTSDASALTGPSVILGYLLLAPAVLATSVAYMVFLSTPLGLEPGGDYAHISRTFGSPRIAFLGAWLKLISYLGAATVLAMALAGYMIELALQAGLELDGRFTTPLALLSLLFFFLLHAAGVRWFGRLQVAMCAVLGVSILVLVVPGLFAVEMHNYRPFFKDGAGGLAAALFPLFFAYAGFESLAHTAGEVKDSTRRLPRVFLKGIAASTLIFVSMSFVAFGVMPSAALEASDAPMAEAASAYLPAGAALVVTIGGVLAVATSLNATLFVPARLGVMLARDDLLPAWIGSIRPASGTPVLGLGLSFSLALLLLLTGEIQVALQVALLALVTLYLVHSVALLVLPRFNPELYASAATSIPRRMQVFAAWVSILSMGGLIAVQVVQDCRVLAETKLGDRISELSLTSLELILLWSLVGLLLYHLRRRPRA